MPNDSVLETDRLILRRFSIGDAGFVLELLNEPAFIRFIGDRGVRTADAAREYILRGPMDSYARHGYGLYLTELKAGHIPIGTCGLVKRDFLSDAEIGFALLPQFWSSGYAFEAAAAVMTYGRDVVGLTRVLAVVSPGNERSIRLLGRLGMHFERMLAWPDDGSAVQLFTSAPTGNAPDRSQ